MTTFVHCMVCFAFPVPDMKFFLSGCGHVACFTCVQKGSMTLKCKVCQKDNPQILEINRNLKPELRDLFTPLAAGFSKITREIGYTLEFQNGHRQRLIRHLQSKSCNFERLQQFCKDEIKKKNQYKQDLQRVRIEYKKKCEEAMELKAKIADISSRTASLSDLTHDPFRTPNTGNMAPHRSFVTSTPYTRNGNSGDDITEATTFAMNQTNSSSSFAAAGIPLVSMDSGGEVSKLAHMTSAMLFTDCSTKTSQTRQNTKRPEEANITSNPILRPMFSGSYGVYQQPFENLTGPDRNRGHQDELAPSSTHFASKTPATKKSRMDMMSKTQPLPMKSV